VEVPNHSLAKGATNHNGGAACHTIVLDFLINGADVGFKAIDVSS
jgi:hypothetical protein